MAELTEYRTTVKGIDNIIFYSPEEVKLAEALWAFCVKNNIGINEFFPLFAHTLRMVKEYNSQWIG